MVSENISIKRIYESPSETDGYRILIDKLWPRGISKENAHLDEWLKTIAPSDEIRKWFNHENARFEEFSKRYQIELENKKEEIQHLLNLSGTNKLTLLYAAKNEECNNAVVLLNVLNQLKNDI